MFTEIPSQFYSMVIFSVFSFLPLNLLSVFNSDLSTLLPKLSLRKPGADFH